VTQCITSAPVEAKEGEGRYINTQHVRFCAETKENNKANRKKSMMIQMGLVRVFRETQVASNDVLEQAHTGISD